MQSQSVMIDYLQNEVKPGEQLLWWGKPEPSRKAKTPSTATAVYIVNGILAIFMVFLIAFDIHLLNEESSLFSGPDPFTVLLLIVAIGLLGLNLYRIYAAYSVAQKHITNLRHTIYGITNQRVIVMTAGTQGFAVNSYGANDIGQINRVETGDGWGDVSFGKPRHIQQGVRTLTIVEKLVGIPEVQKVADILTRTFKIAPPAATPPAQTWYPQQPAQPYPPTPQQYME